MKKTLIILTIAIAGIIISGLIFGAGYFVSRVNFGLNGDSLTRMNQGRAKSGSCRTVIPEQAAHFNKRKDTG